jgi:hypothetical protein
MKKSTRIFLYSLVLFGIVGLVISIVQYFVKGISIDWTSSTLFFAVITCALAAEATAKEKKAKKKEEENKDNE